MSPEARWNRLCFIYRYASTNPRLRSMLTQVGKSGDDEAERYLTRELSVARERHVFSSARQGTPGSYEPTKQGSLLYCPACGAPRHVEGRRTGQWLYFCPSFCGYGGYVIVPSVLEDLLVHSPGPDNDCVR